MSTGSSTAATSGHISIQTDTGKSTGGIDLTVGTNVRGIGGTVSVKAGDAFEGGKGGSFEVETGTATFGPSGAIDMQTGAAAADGVSGNAKLATGTTITQRSGSLSLQTGSPAGASGDASLNIQPSRICIEIDTAHDCMIMMRMGGIDTMPLDI